MHFENLVYSEAQLFPLHFKADDASKWVAAIKREPIRNVALLDVFYLDLHYLGCEWLDALDLPNAYSTAYVVPCECVAWQTRRRNRFVHVRCPPLGEVFRTLWEHCYDFTHGSVRPSLTHILRSMNHNILLFAMCSNYLRRLYDAHSYTLFVYYSTAQ